MFLLRIKQKRCGTLVRVVSTKFRAEISANVMCQKSKIQFCVYFLIRDTDFMGNQLGQTEEVHGGALCTFHFFKILTGGPGLLVSIFWGQDFQQSEIV